MDNEFNNIKSVFPTLDNNPTLAYFDSAASTQTHYSVLKAMNEYYEHERCNVHRGDYPISRSASDKVETARQQVATLLNAHEDQIIFTAGATDGLNIVADWSQSVEHVFITDAEHTANILPWIGHGRTVDNGKLIVLPTQDDGSIDLQEADRALSKHPGSVLSMIATSNVTGATTPWRTLANMAKQYGITVCIDACQTISSHQMDMQSCPEVDFAVFSSHKMFGPTGTGILYCKHDLSKLRPVRFGGGTIDHYDFNGNINWAHGPHKHEPGTCNIAGIIGTGIAAEWINYIGYDAIDKKLCSIHNYLRELGIYNIPSMSVVNGDTTNVLSFVCQSHPGDLGALLGNNGVAVRTGKLCAHPLVNRLSEKGVLRLSWHVYNTDEDCEKLMDELWKITQKLA
jgi:cysteine desulfurase/selenocysteine lyase